MRRAKCLAGASHIPEHSLHPRRIVRDMPELRIVDDGLWQASRGRQCEISKQHSDLTEAVRKHRQTNALGG
ncbi:hypothetical protein [Novosphingobium sp. BL-52-GroH]|uniref:hypothetical protein n=1 Tax=Novosphingobium sp. BL-52-GroH TaxID=3349877 RepID=UPI00384BDED8